MMPIVAPFPTMEQKPKIVENYEQCEWRKEDMTLVEFLRKTNEKGDIIRWLKEAWKGSKTEEDLETFANDFKTTGQKLVAADTVSRLNDNFYGQWFALHQPFRKLKLRMPRKITDKVTPRYQNFAATLFFLQIIGATMITSDKTWT